MATLADFRVLTFDCYGTLIDWEAGIEEALRPSLASAAARIDRRRLLEAFGRHEADEQRRSPTMPYPALLAAVARRLGAELGVPIGADAADAFGASVGSWPAFADSAAALAELKTHYKLVVLSNVDRASFAASNAKLGVTFDAVFTAEEIGSYKPDPANFAYLLDRLAERGFAAGDILHTAQSLFHDIVPARAIGLATCWINRRGAAHGATVAAGAAIDPTFHFGTLIEMAEARRRGP